MSGHSKWHSIKHQKAAADAKKGAAYTKLIKELTVIAREGGGNPDTNPRLRAVMQKAKEANMPSDNVKMAIKRGTGEIPGIVYENVRYEAYGPGGVALLVHTITDNKNRALTNVRTMLGKNGGNMASAGSVSWKFSKKAFLLVDPKGKAADAAVVELTLIDCGADDLKNADEGKFEVYAAPEKLGEVKKAVEAAGFRVEKDELVWQAKEELKITELETARKIVNLVDVLDEDEDVVRVTTNVDFEESLLAQL